ncbi:MAG: phytanoyl-CoA dioxygenase family protein [Capsulimonadales bacterium]|nr:phytanoyl-CoA dioxygenase family protein [Capsulimonadales bacterium]
MTPTAELPDASALPPLATDYPLSAQQINEYQRDGHILLRSVATTEEIEPHREVITSVTTEYARGYKPLEQRDTYGKAFIQFTNLWQRFPAVAAFTLARRFAKIAAELMGVDGVRIYHDQALYKEPAGGHTPWHQDQQYWPLDGVRTVTLWMPLVDASADMGTMRFASGSQELGYLGPLNISDESEAQLEELVRGKGYPLFYAGDMAAGDATFHNGWTIHGAPGNASPTRTREVMTVIYLEDDAVITEPDHASRVNDLASWFPGLRPGDKAASAINPLVYHRIHRP